MRTDTIIKKSSVFLKYYGKRTTIVDPLLFLNSFLCLEKVFLCFIDQVMEIIIGNWSFMSGVNVESSLIPFILLFCNRILKFSVLFHSVFTLGFPFQLVAFLISKAQRNPIKQTWVDYLIKLSNSLSDFCLLSLSSYTPPFSV